MSESAMDTEAVPRLMIEKLVLENFKSYANEITIGPFHKVVLNTSLPTYFICSIELGLM